MQTSTKNKWLERVTDLFQTGNYLRALDVIGEAMKEFPDDSELEQLETLAWSGLGKSPEIGRKFSKAEREELEGPHEPHLGTKTLLGRIEDRRRDRIVEACLCQARWLKSQDDAAGALRALDGGLHRFPHEPRLVQLRDSLYVASGSVKRQPPSPFEDASYETNVRPAPLEGFQKPVEPAGMTVERLPAKPAPVERSREPAKSVPSPFVTRPQILAGGGTAVMIFLIIGAVRLLVAPKAPAILDLPSPKRATLEITTSPAGAVVLVDGKKTDAAALLLGVPLDAGPVPIEARLPGYQTARTTANLRSGVHSELTLTLMPVLEFQLVLPADGQISVNNEESVTVEGGTFSREFTLGTYAVKITTAGNGLMSFAFPVESGGPAVLSSLPTARDLTALLISSFGQQGRIYTAGPPIKIKLDGHVLGEITEVGLDLPKMTAGTHELELGDEQVLRKTWVDFGTSRRLTVIADFDPNTGIRAGQ